MKPTYTQDQVINKMPQVGKVFINPCAPKKSKVLSFEIDQAAMSAQIDYALSRYGSTPCGIWATKPSWNSRTVSIGANPVVLDGFAVLENCASGHAQVDAVSVLLAVTDGKGNVTKFI